MTFSEYYRLVEDMDAGQQQPPAIVQRAIHPDQQLMNDYINFLNVQENDAKAGWNGKRWMPHKSVEKGNDTIAYGHKITDKEIKNKRFKDGLTEQQAVQLLYEDITKHALGAKAIVDKAYKPGTWMKLPIDVKLMFTELNYNPGLSKFPTFMKAVMSNNWTGKPDSADRQYTRKTGKTSLTRRNNAFYNLFLKKRVDAAKKK